MESKSNNRFMVYPLVKQNGEWSIPEIVLLKIWERILKEGKLEDLFYDGTIKTPFEWMEFIKRSGTYPILIVDESKKEVVHIAWLKDYFGVGAWVHHCSLGKYRRGAWETAKEYWKTYFTELKLLLGMTPETNEKALKILTKICKFTVVGKVPHLCNMAYQGKRVAGVFSYYDLEED